MGSKLSLACAGIFSAAVLGSCAAPALSGDDDAATAPSADAVDASVTDATLGGALGSEEGAEPSSAVGADEESADDDAQSPPDPDSIDDPRFHTESSGVDGGPDGGPPPSIGSFALYATESIEINAGALVTGCNVGVEGASGPYLNGGVAAYFNSNGQIAPSETLYAASVFLNSGATIGPVATNHITNQHGTYGALSPFPAMPAPPGLPAATAGTTSITLNSGSRTLTAGAYGSVMLNAGTTLSLTGGSYVFSSLTLNSNATLSVSAATTISVTGSSSFNSGSFIGPASGSGLTAKALTLYFDSSSGISLNSNAKIQALFVATNAQVTVNTSQFTGALAAAEVVMNSGATITCQDSFGSLGGGGTCSGSCDDGNACTTDACSSGTCTHTPVANGTMCNDGNACTQSDSCQSGACTGANPVTCSASDQCHVGGSCNTATGVCSNPAATNGTTCNDGNACTQTDTCESGTCTGSSPVVCSASDQCHVGGTCNTATGACSNPAAPNGTSCNDGNACDLNDSCVAGVCTAGGTIACTASDACHVAGACDPLTGACSNPAAADGTACNDGNACDSNDTCQSGACTAGTTTTCTASDQCHVRGTCDPTSGRCSNPAAADGTACSDGNLCVFAGSETCASGACAGTPKCGGTECIASQCDPSSGTCAPAIEGTPCSGGACDGNGHCATGTIATSITTLPPACPPATSPCSTGPGVYDSLVRGCYYLPAPAGTVCPSGVCDGNNNCVAPDGGVDGGQSYVAVEGTACPTAGACTNPGSIDFATGACVYVNLAAGTACAGGACDGNGKCSQATDAGADSGTGSGDSGAGSDSGTDAGSGPCDDGNPCTVDKRNADSSCSHYLFPDGTSCSDGNKCDSNDTCQVGVCTPGATVTCAASDQCHSAGTCDPTTGACTNPVAANGTSCNDGNACTQTDACQSGVCAGSNPVTCTASDPCHSVGTCNPATGACSNPAAANGTACNDGNACDLNDTCQNGTCSAGSTVTCTAADQCHVAGVCDPASGTCSNPAASNGTACNDGNPCTTTDQCTSGTCSGTAVTCTAEDACHVAGTCDPSTGTCTNPPQTAGTACGSNTNLCAGALLCDGNGTCVQGAPPVINTSNPCLVGSCSPTAGVTYVPVPAGAACASNSDLCVGAYTCDGLGDCTQGPPPVIDTSNPCMVGSCSPDAGVTYTPDPGAACGNNTNLCGTTYVCNAAGTCQTNPPPAISPPNNCFTGACDPTTGNVTYTPIAGCDPNPTTGGAFETQASMIGQVVDSNSGGGVTGYTLTAYDNATTSAPRTDLSATVASDGSFRARFTSFPTSEPPRSPPHMIIVEIDAAGYISAFRTMYVHPGMAVNVGTINLVARDPKVTNIGPAGGTATDSQGLVEVDIPAGALTTTQPIQITAFKHRGDLAYPLPTNSVAGYAMELEPDGLQFQTPVTVRVANWRSEPTNLSIPVGLLNKSNGTWSHAAYAAWDGQMFAFKASHFSQWDVNLKNVGEWIMSVTRGKNTASTANKCGGSTFGLANGTVRQSFTLPSVMRRRQDYAVGLNYDSRLTFGSDQPTTDGGVGSVGTTGVVASGTGVKISMTCMSQSAADNVLATSPGSCGGGTCSLNDIGSASLAPNMTLSVGVNGNNSELAVSTGGNSVEWDTDFSIPIPLNDQGGISAPGFFSSSFSLENHGSGCVAGGEAFGTSELSGSTVASNSSEANPLAAAILPTFVYHRHSSPYGIGWGINGISQLFTSPAGDEAVIVSGEGDVEEFMPRVRVTRLGSTNQSHENVVYALDPNTGSLYRVAASTNTIDLVNPTTGAVTSGVVSGFALPSSAEMMAIGYVGGVQHFLVACDSGLVDIPSGGQMRTLASRNEPTPDGQLPLMYSVSSVAVVGNFAYYVTGVDAVGPNNTALTPPLYRIDLTATSPTAQSITAPQGGDEDLYPTGLLSTYAMGDPHGLAPGPNGGLFVADRRRSALYQIAADSNGQVSGNSPISVVIGPGSRNGLSPLGAKVAGMQFGLVQPGEIFDGPDGMLWIFTAYGTAMYDPLSSEAKWIIFDNTIPGSEDTFSLFNGNYLFPTAFVPVGATSLFGSRNGNSGGSVYRLDLDMFSSVQDPTRTLAYSYNAGVVTGTLTDTTQDLVEAYDPGGRLIERQTREGDPILTVSYVGDSSAIQSINDPLGGSTTFAYSSGLLSSITDQAGRVTTLHYNGADLAYFQEPDGETWQFGYIDHRMISKTSPDQTDNTSYGYASDGTVNLITKPANETIKITSVGYAQPAGGGTGTTTFTSVYTDTHGVQHTVTTDEYGRETTDVYTASGVTYTLQHNRETALGSDYTANNNDVFLERSNELIGREFGTILNGIATSPQAEWDSMGRFIGTNSYGVGTEQYVTYDANGRVATYTPANNLSDYFVITRDANGHPIKIAEGDTSGSTFVERREVDMTWVNGLVHTSTVHGVTTTFTDDPTTLNVASTVDTVGRTSAFTYDAAGSAATANDGTTTWTFTHDGNGRLSTATDAENNVTKLSYVQAQCGCSEGSLLTSLQTPDLVTSEKAWQFTYGFEGRLATLTDPDGNPTTYGYAPTGELASLLDANGHTTKMGYDQLGRLTSIVDALGRAHARGYATPVAGAWSGQDILSGSASSTPASNGLTAKLNPGDYQVGTNAYDLNGGYSHGWPSIQFYQDAAFQLSYGRTFDDFNRTTSVEERPTAQFATTTAQPSSSGQYVYEKLAYSSALPSPILTSDQQDVGGNGIGGSLSYNNEWDLTQFNGDQTSIYVTSNNVTVTRDTAGRPTKVETTEDNVGSHPNLVYDQNYTYYATGQLHTSPQGTFTYDDRGLVKTRVVASGTYTYGYDSLGRNNSLTFPDGHTRTQGYDNEGRVNSRCYVYPNAPGGTVTNCYGAIYDPVGNPTTLSDPFGEDTITYDNLDRVTSVTRSNTPDVETYTYNAMGALNYNATVALPSQRPVIGGTTLVDSAVPGTFEGQPVTMNVAGQITSLGGVPIGYDGKNSLTGFAGQTLHRDLMKRISDNETTQTVYTYDGANRSSVWAWPTTGGSTWQRSDFWLYDGVDHPLEHDDVNGNALYYELDLAGNVRRLMGPGGVDEGGYRYTAFGETYTDDADFTPPTGAASLPLRWKGAWLMYSTGSGGSQVDLYDMRARWWCPQAGVFLQVDGVAYHDQQATLWSWPGQNPYSLRDPTGHTGLTNAQFLWDFLTGGGKTNRTYGLGDIQGAEEAVSAGAQALRDAFYAGGQADVSGFSYGTGEAAADTLFDPSEWGDTAFQVGGYAGATAVNNGDGTVTFTIPNVAGANSFFYHLIPNRKASGSFRTITQTFTWTEAINQCPAE